MYRNWIFCIIVVLLFFGLFGCSQQPSYDYAKFVDPIIGTGVYSREGTMGESNTFPGPALPHGMVQLSPDTGPHIAGYFNSDSTIQGFSHTHLSGTGCWGLGNFLVMPITGSVKIEESEYKSAFDKSSEKASPGYYAVKLKDYNINTELTATRRAGLHRYSFPASESSHLLFDISHNLADEDPLNATVQILDNNKITGSITLPEPFCGGKTPYTIYFAAITSKPFKSFGTWSNGEIQANNRITSGLDIGCYVDFSTDNEEEIFLKAGVSFVDEEQALLNAETEIPNWDFAEIKKQAREAWNNKLNRIQVKGGTKTDKVKFYTALYHSLLGPYTASDVNGKYRGLDSKIHTTDNTYYHVYSLWDTFRSEHPLLTLIEPEQQNEMVVSLLEKQKQGGWLPKWEFANRYTNCMIADHATSIIAESYLKGIRNYDTEHAYRAMKKNSVRLPGRGNIKVLSNSEDFVALQLNRDGKAYMKWSNNKNQELDFDWKFIYNDMQWHHYTMTYNKNHELQIYLDSKKVAENKGEIQSLENNRGVWRIGVHREGNKSGRYFTGNFGEICFYDRSLSKKEISKLAKRGVIEKGRQLYFSDESVIPQNMTVSGEPEYENGVFGSSIAFDGIDDMVEIKDPNPNQNGITISFWFKTSAPTDFQGRRGLDYYLRYGYIPHDTDWGGWGSVSTTLEDAYNDYCVAQVAKDMGKNEDYREFREKATYYKNVFDQTTGFMRPKNKQGEWKKDFDPQDWAGFTEGNSWSYTWFVPHDVSGLKNLMGTEKFVDNLDHMFSQFSYPKWGGAFSHYWHGNEPSQQVPYYYNYVKQPWKTQRIVDKIMNELYGTGPAGIPGNEDVGQLSAWFVLSAMGFHPVAPAQCTYLVGRPLFDEVIINLDEKYYNSSKFVIKTKNNSKESRYIQSLSINGKKTNQTWFDHNLIQNGGEIIFEMGDKPNRNWGIENSSIPPSMSDNR